MAFQPAGNFLLAAAKKYNLDKQALAGLICSRASTIFEQNFPEFSKQWEPLKFQHGKLSIKVTDAAASSALFMRTFEVIELLSHEDLPAKVNEILIVRSS